MIELTEQQCQAVGTASEPVTVVNPATRREYVLLPAETFQRMRELLEAEHIDESLYEFEEPDSPRP